MVLARPGNMMENKTETYPSLYKVYGIHQKVKFSTIPVNIGIIYKGDIIEAGGLGMTLIP